MTAGTIIIGLLPLTGWFVSIPALGPLLEAVGLAGGEGAEIRAPVAVTVIGGLTVATLLTLVVIPVVYYLVGLITPGTKPVVVAQPAPVSRIPEPVQ